MTRMRSRFRWLLAGLLGAAAAAAPAAPDGAQIIQLVDKVLWGEKSSTIELEMTVVRPQWTRSLVARAWAVRPDKSFAHITRPAKDAGTRSLVIGSEMWNYFPSVERTIKIPPSMLLQPWMGSDVTNEDLLDRAGRTNHYTHTVSADATVDGVPVHEVESRPKPDAPVTWGRIVLQARRSDHVPLRETFYDERGAMVRETLFGEVKSFGRHVMPTRWEVRPANKPGHSTVVRILSAQFDEPIPDDTFSLRNLSRKE
jgi:outer membrane lipoprotein-sorting protein